MRFMIVDAYEIIISNHTCENEFIDFISGGNINKTLYVLYVIYNMRRQWGIEKLVHFRNIEQEVWRFKRRPFDRARI